ncbi:hypothetical protein D1007_07375 [Hordeum vulgare]|nr:hypothetical protein D1007_07375 [Hordeum vulgare]
MGCEGSEEAIRPPSCPASVLSSSLRSEKNSSHPSSSLSRHRRPLRAPVTRSHGWRFFLEEVLGAEGVLTGSLVGQRRGRGAHRGASSPSTTAPGFPSIAAPPWAETAPAPATGEVVVFVEHFYWGFGLPASSFFAEWIHFFVLWPYHLAPNGILQLAAFVVLCEGFVGIEPHVDLWRSLFFFKQRSIAMEKFEVEKLTGPSPMTPCGAALVHHRSKYGFHQMPLQESIKHWQKGFFYVKSADPAQDALNMPPFDVAPSTRRNWDAKTPKPIPRKSGLLVRDLLTTMVVRRILPLQRRPYLVCQMGGRHDPCRLSTKRFTPDAVARTVNLISIARMDESGEWTWGMSPFNRAHPPPMLFETLQGSLRPLATDVEVSGALEIEDKGVIESRSDSSAGSEDSLESEGTEPYGEYARPTVADWTDDDEIASFCSGAAFEEDSDEVEEVTSPPLMRGRRQMGGATAADEAAGNKGKGATASRPACKRPVPGPPAGQRAGGVKRRCGAARGREAKDVDEDTASAAERAGWAVADAAQRELETESKRRWDTAAGKAAVGQPRPSRVERPVEKRAKARHDPPHMLMQRSHLARPPPGQPHGLRGPIHQSRKPRRSRSKVEQSTRMVCSDMERVEACTQALYDAQAHAYNELQIQHLGADSRIAELEARLGEAAAERDAVRNAGNQLQEQLDLLQTEKKELETAGPVELERLRATLQEKEASYSADVDRLTSLHLKEMDLKDAALREKEEALVQKQTQLAKALESAATLQEEVARLTHAIKVREREVLKVSHETDGTFYRLFSETQIAADTAVEVCCEERRAAGQEIDTTSGWSVKEIGVSLQARLRALGESVAQLQVVGSYMVATLWPDGVEPASMSRLARWVAAGGERLDAWRASAAQARAYMALRLTKSWYPNLNLGKLAAQRDCSEAELQGMKEALWVRASAVAEYAAWEDFVLERGDDGGVIAEYLHGLRPYDTDDSSDKAARAMESAAASSGAAYADSGADGARSPREGDGATASGAAGDGDATTSGAAAGATDEAAAP